MAVSGGKILHFIRKLSNKPDILYYQLFKNKFLAIENLSEYYCENSEIPLMKTKENFQ
jgi:hypothetical protein